MKDGTKLRSEGRPTRLVMDSQATLTGRGGGGRGRPKCSHSARGW